MFGLWWKYLLLGNIAVFVAPLASQVISVFIAAGDILGLQKAR